eukprot:338807_1
MMAQAKVYCKPTITEMHRTLNISDIMDNIDTYATKQKLVCDEWMVDDLHFSLVVYPQGNRDDVDKAMSIFLKIVALKGGSEKDNKGRKVHATMKYGHINLSFLQPIHQFRTGYGWFRAIYHHTKHSNIDFMFKLYHYPLFIQLPSQSFEQKLEKVHLLSQAHGDITLIVKLNHLDENKLDNFEPPSKKK